MVNWLGLAVPFAYLSILIGSLATFSSLYRKRKLGRLASSLILEPWFPPHLQRNIYLSLLHLEPTPGQEKTIPVPDSVLKAALLQRACEDIRRILSVRSAKPALSQLLQRGSVGDELWQRFLRAEKEMEAELKDVMEEANALQAGWGQIIFQSANEMVNNEIIREKVAEIQAKAQTDRERWDRERASIQSQFMKELDDDAPSTTEHKTSAGAAVPGNAGSERINSDEDTVMVEGGGPASSGPATGKGGKKRKGRK
ncbi:MAG: hypothetical protein Q9163_002537 [Psora crenata]